MKKRTLFLITCLLSMAGVQTAFAQKMLVKLADNRTFGFNVSQVECVMFEEGAQDNVVDESHEWVDLGLPSATLWATCNIGANSPEEVGDYFAWGETEPKESYSWGNYMWMTEGQSDWQYISKYTVPDEQTEGCWYDGEEFIGDGKKKLEPDDDAAAKIWGGK